MKNLIDNLREIKKENDRTITLSAGFTTIIASIILLTETTALCTSMVAFLWILSVLILYL